jgi:outer membrane protein OmpA-like peptidoglycan-associated protein
VAAGAPSADLAADKAGDEPLIKEPAAPKKKGQRAKTTARHPAKKKKAAAAPAADAEAPAPAPEAEAAAPAAPAPQSGGEKPSKPSSGTFELQFGKNTHQLTPEAEKRLAQIADTVAYYPLESLKIQGFAQPTESNAAQLAERRAKMVAGLLLNKYQIDPKKISVASSVSETATYGVQVGFVKDQ